jgi:hypothetical protein
MLVAALTVLRLKCFEPEHNLWLVNMLSSLGASAGLDAGEA